MDQRKKILFFAEAATLSHVLRPHELAKKINPSEFQVYFAYDHDSYQSIIKSSENIHYIDLDKSIKSKDFQLALKKKRFPYTKEQLIEQVKEDRSIFQTVCPDIVVGDSRISLSISSSLENLTYICLSDLIWNVENENDFQIPEMNIVKYLGLNISNMIFKLVAPVVFKKMMKPYNECRRAFGLSPVLEYSQIFASGHRVLYMDHGALYKKTKLRMNHQVIGPVLANPQVPLPRWWSEVTQKRPWIYVCLGSSGNQDLLPMVIHALKDLPVEVLVAGGGVSDLDFNAKNVWVADYLPGEIVASHSSLVICNGGTPGAYQALAEGVPFIGIPSNMHQSTNMFQFEKLGVGRLLRPEGLYSEKVKDTVLDILSNYRLRIKTMELREILNNNRSFEVFNGVLKEVANEIS